MTVTLSRQYCIGYDRGWSPTLCPRCGKEAAWHGFLYKEEGDERVGGRLVAVGEVFGHPGADECISSSEPPSAPVGRSVASTGARQPHR